MEPEPSPNHSAPSDSNSHSHFGRDGAFVSARATSQHRADDTRRKKCKVRLNDQLIPKPTDINMAEKMIKVATPKQHPYSSHMSRFAVFPSFRSPDDPETGLRAASQPFLSPLIPTGAPAVTLLSKTMGSPYRQEILESPMKARKKAVIWTGEHGFLDHPKPHKGGNQIFYPTPPKSVLPNPKLRDWDSSLSERESNMLRNLERTHWVTSYQMHYTGLGPANPLKMDDYGDKMRDLAGMNPHSAPLREKSFPVFVPSKPRKGRRRSQGRSTCSPTAAELLNPCPAAAATEKQHRAGQSEAPHPRQNWHGQSQYDSGSTETQGPELSHGVLHKQNTESNSFLYEGRARENCRVQFAESPMKASVWQSSEQANSAAEPHLDPYDRPLSQGEKSQTDLCVKDQLSSKRQPFKAGRNSSSLSQSDAAKDLAGIEPHTEFLSGADRPHSISDPCVLQRPPVLPGIHPDGTVMREGAALSLLDLQNSFSKTKAHHNFNNSVARARVNLRDNLVTGKKHDFFGINCYYLHG